jgi:hypothetical protein
MQKLLLTLAFGIATSFAANIVAVLEIIPSNDNVNLEVSEFRHLTDELRTRARETLPRNAYSILTRDNIIQLLPPDEKEAECLAESCAVDIGRAIGAEYVTQGFVGNFAGMLTLTVELYESMSGNMLGSFVTESEDVKGLLMTIREKAPGLFGKLSESLSEPVIPVLKDLQNKENPALQPSQTQPIATNIPLDTPKKSGTSLFVAIGLDVLGAAAIGFGIYKHIDSNKLYDDYKKKPAEPITQDDYDKFKKQKDKLLKDSNSAGTLSNVGYAVGGALLAAGIAVHIWF